MENLNLVELTPEEQVQTNGGIYPFSLVILFVTAIVIAIVES